MSVPLELWTLVVCLCPYNRVMLLFFEKRHLVDVPTHTPAPRLRLFSLSIGGPRWCKPGSSKILTSLSPHIETYLTHTVFVLTSAATPAPTPRPPIPYPIPQRLAQRRLARSAQGATHARSLASRSAAASASAPSAPYHASLAPQPADPASPTSADRAQWLQT